MYLGVEGEAASRAPDPRMASGVPDSVHVLYTDSRRYCLRAATRETEILTANARYSAEIRDRVRPILGQGTLGIAPV